MKILIITLISTLTVFGQIDMLISTDRDEYAVNDTIHITLHAINNGSGAAELTIENECEAAYFMGDWFSLEDTSLACLRNPHNLFIAAGDSVSWNWDYFIEDHPENVGKTALNGVLFLTYGPPIFSELLFIQIGESDSAELVSGFMPAVDTLLIVGGCIMPELILEPDAMLGDYQKLTFKDAYDEYSINLNPRANWDSYINSTFFWFSHDSIPFTFTARLETIWDTLELPIGESLWLDDGLLKIFIHDEDTIVDSITQLINVHVTGAVSDKRPMYSNLIKAYPNPFNPHINLSFSLEERAATSISVFNIRGEEIYFTNLGLLNPADYHYEWQGVDHQNRPVISGIYLIQIVSNKKIMTKKVTLLK